MEKKVTKIAYIAITCLLLANIVRACAPEWGEKTNAQTTNNQTLEDSREQRTN